jgi:hypothetical protein
VPFLRVVLCSRRRRATAQSPCVAVVYEVPRDDPRALAALQFTQTTSVPLTQTVALFPLCFLRVAVLTQGVAVAHVVVPSAMQRNDVVHLVRRLQHFVAVRALPRLTGSHDALLVPVEFAPEPHHAHPREGRTACMLTVVGNQCARAIQTHEKTRWTMEIVERSECYTHLHDQCPSL